MEDRRFRRVQVLRLGIIQHTAAECDHMTAHVDDREHDTVAEPVVNMSLFAAADQTGIHEFLARVAFGRHRVNERVEGIRCIAESEAVHRPSGQTSVDKILLCGSVFLIKYSSVRELMTLVQNILEINYSVRVDWGFVVQTILTVFVTWVFIVVLGYFVETLIYTLVHKTKLTSFIVFVAYILCFWGVVSADNAILNAISKSSQVMQSSVEILFFLVINTVLYVASAWLMDKKLSV